MPIPYLLTTLMFTFVALLAAADASLVSVNLVGAFPALRWVRAHFITLGIVSQVIFGLLPLLVASLSKKPRRAMRWDIWLTLNGGFVALVAGKPRLCQRMANTYIGLIWVYQLICLPLILWIVRGYFDHFSPEGKSHADRLRAAGVYFRCAAENIAFNHRGPKSVVNLWMGSTGHRRNILRDDLTKVGIGSYNRYYVLCNSMAASLGGAPMPSRTFFNWLR